MNFFTRWLTRTDRTTEALLLLLDVMSKVQLAQADVMQRFMKSYDTTEAPQVRVMTDAVEWQAEVDAAVEADAAGRGVKHPQADAMFWQDGEVD